MALIDNPVADWFEEKETELWDWAFGDGEEPTQRTFAEKRADARDYLSTAVCKNDMSYLEYKDAADQLRVHLSQFGLSADYVPEPTQEEYVQMQMLGGCAVIPEVGPATMPQPGTLTSGATPVTMAPRVDPSMTPWIIGGLATAAGVTALVWALSRKPKKRRRRRRRR